jgi:hypothetical protein
VTRREVEPAQDRGDIAVIAATRSGAVSVAIGVLAVGVGLRCRCAIVEHVERGVELADVMAKYAAPAQEGAGPGASEQLGRGHLIVPMAFSRQEGLDLLPLPIA